MMDALRKDDLEEFAKRAKASPGYKPLAMVAYDLAVKGITSIEEVMKLAEING
jgi:MSHA biogenesis protein MshE